MQLHVGTSGFHYPEWRGEFYPAQLRPREFLHYYAQRLPSVEINQSFYKLPQPEQLRGWAAQVPEDFRFCVKTPRRISHGKRLRGAGAETAALLEALRALGPRLGALMVQLPPDFECEPERLATFLRLLPAELPLAFEFRHPSWEQEARVVELLAERGALRVASDAEGDPPALGAATARCGYLRLRRDQYSAAELEQWAGRLRAQPWAQAFVYFKHEREGPARAHALRAAFEAAGGAPQPPRLSGSGG